jgi:hypothetical protein
MHPRRAGSSITNAYLASSKSSSAPRLIAGQDDFERLHVADRGASRGRARCTLLRTPEQEQAASCLTAWAMLS